jgi:hypothetical protein
LEYKPQVFPFLIKNTRYLSPAIDGVILETVNAFVPAPE